MTRFLRVVFPGRLLLHLLKVLVLALVLVLLLREGEWETRR